MNLFAIALLAVQPWVNPLEQSYGPYLAPANGGEPAIVASQDRGLLAWSELDPFTKRASIRAGVLDFSGQLVSEIRTLPAFIAGSEAMAPVVATDGRTFGVAWLEGERRNRLAAIVLDPDGAPVAEPLRFGTIFDGPGTPPLVRNGRTYQLAERDGNGGQARTVGYAFDSNGAPATPAMVIPQYMRYASRETQVGMIWGSAPRRYQCAIGGRCGWLDAEYAVAWEIIHGAHLESGSLTFNYYSTSRAVTAGDDDELAIVWRSPTELTGIRVVDDEYHSKFTILDAAGVPEPDAIAFDGKQWLVVYTREGDVWGAFLDRSSKEFEPFPIATSARTESRARVTTLAPGRFLVSYASDLGADDHRFAGRVVTTEAPGKRRVVR